MKQNPPARRRPVNRAARLALCFALAAGTLAFGTSPAEANAPDTTVTINLGQTGKTPTRAGAGFLYGLTQNGSAPADSFLQPLRPTLFRGGGASLSGNGWIGDNYTAGPGYRARINSALDQARRVTASAYNARYDLLVSDLYGPGFDAPPGTIEPADPQLVEEAFGLLPYTVGMDRTKCALDELPQRRAIERQE